MKICNRCILPDTFPGITFDEEGLCSHCRRSEAAKIQTSEQKAGYHERLDKLIEAVKESSTSYHAIMAYSGGKDSSYTLKLLRERYDLKILAFTFDNHFVSPAAQKNIDTIIDKLGVDLIRLRPPWSVMKNLFRTTATEDIFPKATLLRASSVCTACIAIVKSFALKTAIEMNIPLVAFGWSPGQAPLQSAIMRTNPILINKNQEAIIQAFPIHIFNSISQFFLPQEYFIRYQKYFPHNIHPLAFFDYNESKILDELKTMGWHAPDDTDTNSSNCLVNAFANQCHIERHNYHPYVWEIASMVRQKVMDRNEGMKKIYAEQNQHLVEYAKKRLGL